ncbi:uncharacterized protein LOC121942884 [Plectropomus leopardus]|uniref:uncharacterized protein LOC121942879 n=1 Tax=Plectropomus leopardus TaxID=160734 RepID=UPI001C4DD7DB|nr:uncharacterized protein LOC121942879 [Plectropomus leopardus]XP_042342111.1 uncharacterized protein LOC121942883 [Plectropomus leopardus]XP_042342113.1 uncharacterized protein LOC121942884 [Plectropomus leopardus]
MGIRLPCVYFLVFVILQEVPGIKIQNKLLGKCLQAQEGTTGGRVSLGECRPYSAFQEWHWLSHSQALRNHHTGECLTAPGEQYEGVHLQPCLFRAESDETDAEVAVVNMGRDTGSQVWSCSKRGHLTLVGRGLHLSATQESTLIFLSREHKQPGSRWRTLDNQTLCNGRDNKHNHHQPHHNLGKSLERGIFPSAISNTHKQSVPPFPVEGIMTINVTETYTGMDGPLSFLNTTSADPTMVFFSMDYGMGWKITMLVLSSLALVLGTVILILQVYSNRRKKVVCVLKSYTPRPEVSVPGSPVPSERAPLTEHAMRLPHSSPTLQRGEILIQWKDGTVTPLYEA